VPVTAGEKYFLQVGWPAGKAVGANDFYFLLMSTTTSLNPQETNESGNGDSDKAEKLTGKVDQKTTSYYLGGLLPSPDADWWVFAAKKGDKIAVSCSSWRAGSGVRDATFELFSDPKGNALQAETEIESKGVSWSTSNGASKAPVAVAADGNYYLKVSATKQDAIVTAKHYLCGVHVTAP
jgi:hypothetical protein